MINTYFTGASGMIAQQYRLDAAANNLANVDVNGYKKDITTFKAFPELLLHRMNDDGVYRNPFGSSDAAPIIGKLGTGVEFNELFTDFQQGALKESGSDFDLALDGKGFFVIKTPQGERYTRNGAFVLGKEGFLETKEGYPIMGEEGPIRVKANNFQVDKEGAIWINAAYADENMLVERERNTWEDTVKLDTLRIVEFDYDRYIEKQGSSLYRATDTSGQAREIEIDNGKRPRVIQGFTEASNVDPVVEMVNLIEVNRAYEANQKAIQSGDQMLGALINQTARVA